MDYYKFCPYCSNELLLKTEKQGFKRPICPDCGFVHYRNPTCGVAVIIQDGDKILLVRRNGSYAGQWCIPCGHVEWDEDIRECAKREIFEETGLIVVLDDVFAVHSNFHDMRRQTVGVWFKGHIVDDGTIKTNHEVSDAAFFSLNDIPEEMAFPTDKIVIRDLKKEK